MPTFSVRSRPAPRQVERVLDALEERYGRPRLTRRLDPLSELVLTILSQHTSDTNRDRAFADLRARFATWEEVADAPRPAIERAIRKGGLARIKSGVIRDLLRHVRAERGELSLDHLKEQPMEEGRQWLLGLRGVGAKTAACVLLFSCGQPAFPVDTHVHRIARRLGWIPSSASADEAHLLLEALIRPRRRLAAHVNFITLGRELCRARLPACSDCPLRRQCRHAQGWRTP
ncbi:MAG TPA: endonuclease III [Candidatus Polarisedimenticolia bacterium]|jgi:endonuclease-3|nr:endonuclease III [Candidatus Polarisedimenticolia bacterium]